MQPLWDRRSAAKYTPEQCRAVPWFNIDGDNTLRVNYQIGPDSVVYDIGGYLGTWTEEIYKRYKCNIEVFEPIKEFSDIIEQKFNSIPKIRVHSFGLSNKAHKARITYEGASSSTHKSSDSSQTIQLERSSEFIKAHHKRIDLMKINIEGGEYELLEDLIKSGAIKKIANIQVQFHDFVPKARGKSQQLRDQLSKTHDLTYYYPWIWENWRLKK